MDWSWFLPESIERLGRVGAMRRRALRASPVPTSLSRPFGFNPRLRACGCALRLPPGKALRLSPPRDAWHLDTAEPAYAGSARPAPTAMGAALANTLALAAAGCANAGRPQRWRFVPITKDGSRQFTVCLSGIAMELPRHASRPAPQGAAGRSRVGG
ncbi:hypothetical protein J4732_07015 [Serratia marcescens]|uniref:Uncharacterized protein n=1 Tax=Serratia marcescens TaxID=615 RepID=A0A939SUI5_SERMA|nr:hypothetical protein [Serratia marcescens]